MMKGVQHMKCIYTIILVLVFELTSFGQNDSTKVALVSYWSKGDTYKFTITKIKKRWKEGQLTKNDSTTITANFTVLDSTDTSYTIQWRYNNDYLNTIEIPEELKERFRKYRTINVIYSTTEVGEFIGVENLEEISELINNMVDDLVEVSGTDSKEGVQIKKGMESLRTVFNSKQGIEQLVLKELQYFHLPFGYEYIINDTVTYEEQLPNMFGGNPIRGNTKAYLESVDFKNKRFVLIKKMNLNPNDTKELILDLVKKLGAKVEEMENILRNAKYEITDNDRFEYYYFPGIPIRIETKRLTIMDIGKVKGKNIEKTIVELAEQ